MLNRIDTLNTYGMLTKPALSIETNLGDAFDNTSRRPSRVDLKRPETDPETSQRFSNLLSLLPYLDRSQSSLVGIGSKPREQRSGLEVNETDFGYTVTGNE